MKQPTLPKQPIEPIKPKEPLETLISKRQVGSVYLPSSFTIASFLEEVKHTVYYFEDKEIDINDLIFEIENDWNCGSSDLSVLLNVPYPNSRYKSQYKAYLKALTKYEEAAKSYTVELAQYQADIKVYQQEMKRWELEQAEKKIRKLKKELG